MAKYVHIVPHVHWDREWYFSAEESKLLLINNMEEIMDRLENDPDYPTYTLDGQTAILEDYLTLMPQNKERLTKLIQANRLIIGPWYSQSDEMVVGGESIVRNLLYGHLDCKQFGPVMKIGYLPDSFGQSGQLPMILNGFNIYRSIFWRGTSERMGTDKTEFYWQSDDGSKVLTQLLPLGYAIGKYLPTGYEELKKRCDKYMPVLDKGATSNHILLPNGHDQMPLQKNINDVMNQLHHIYPEKKFFLSNYEQLFQELEKTTNYDTIHGECLDGKYMRVHRSIYSSRSDIKSLNTLLENKLTNLLEPLASIAHSLGFEYFHGAIESIWKDMLKNHAHDSIGCCCSDKVHDEIKNRFVLANEKIDRLIDFYQRKITDAIDYNISLDKLTVFNLLPYSRKKVIEANIVTRMKSFELVDANKQSIPFKIIKQEIVDPGLIDRQIVHYGNYDPFVRYTIQFIDEVVAMGYQTYFILESKTMPKLQNQIVDKLENKYYQIHIQKNGTLSIYDKINKTKYDQVLLLEDSGDDGDGYDYSMPIKDMVITSNDVIAKSQIEKQGLKTVAIIDYDLALPKDINSRNQKLKDGKIHVEFKVELFDDSKYINIQANIDNQVKDHRLRVLIPTLVNGKESLSDNQFGMIHRPVYDQAMDIWEKEKWVERPDSIYPMLSYVTIKDSQIALITNSIREYEIIGDNYDTMAITLYRSVGYLGKENLVRRPGRPSGIKMETPDSQLLGTMKYDFCLTTYDEASALSMIAKECLTPLVTYNKMPYNAMKLNDVDFNTPYIYSFFKQNHKNLTLSTLKKAENDDSYIIRVFNTNTKPQKLELNIPISQSVNLNEEQIDFQKEVKYNQVQSYIIKND
ncbi:mannosylglycerate hydrolase [Thomasclavelia sp.]|uniref:mannosylglycerate hydrolase n=1 Tax=Thomasclavelia sp. TaxID=3025757 RepID=UPI00260149D2|nr:mannosylglycerate hydrolase [Thomasclavelia sp.]